MKKPKLNRLFVTILADYTNTPHTSTEISDILTHHLTVKGHPQLTAFVNKGKSFSKVTSKELAHQIARLRQIQGLRLIILARHRRYL